VLFDDKLKDFCFRINYQMSSGVEEVKKVDYLFFLMHEIYEYFSMKNNVECICNCFKKRIG
jgi:ABC-type Zn2+ transport system substrate-binding protein/surface adhesin